MTCADKGRDEQTRRFRDAALSCLDDAYTLAVFLTGSRTDAEDAVEECYLRAAHLFNTRRGPATKQRLLAILRSVCASKLARREGQDEKADLPGRDDQTEQPLEQDQRASCYSTTIIREEEATFRRLIHLLPLQLREAITLRELNGLSYHQIAEVTGVSLGTATQRVAEARTLLLGKIRQRFATGQRKTRSAA
jgi:RNA polymerase sigma-70 factor (ECF subfamily)